MKSSIKDSTVLPKIALVVISLIVVSVLFIVISFAIMMKKEHKTYIPEVGLWIRCNFDRRNTDCPRVEFSNNDHDWTQIPIYKEINNLGELSRINIINPSEYVDSTFISTYPYNTAPEIESYNVGIVCYAPESKIIYIPYGVAWGLHSANSEKDSKTIERSPNLPDVSAPGELTIKYVPIRAEYRISDGNNPVDSICIPSHIDINDTLPSAFYTIRIYPYHVNLYDPKGKFIRSYQVSKPRLFDH